MSEPPSSDPVDLEPLTRTQVLIALGATAILLLAIATIWRQFGGVALFPWHWDVSALLLGGAVGGGITIASSIIYRLWPRYRHSADFYLKLVLEPLHWPDLIWLALLPGLSEELLFRGVMLPALGMNWVGLLLSSACFGILHLSGLKQWPYAIWATIVGCVLGYSALISHNLLVPIVAHIATNLISSGIWKFRHQNPGESSDPIA